MSMDDAELEARLVKKCQEYFYDPLGFVMWAFDWNKPPLNELGGPDEWQRDVMRILGNELRKQDQGDQLPAKIAIASGHGIGKTAFMSMIIIWWMSTRPRANIVVTANTGDQLETKTWRELGLWHERAINAHWFEHTATAFFAKEDKKKWRANALVWSSDRPAAFAGTHDRTGAGVLYLFDEASEIPYNIYETSEGAMTDPGAGWLMFGNPTTPSGPFFDIFDKKNSGWITKKIDSRTCALPNKKLINQWRDLHGEDSDFFKVRVRGEFPAEALHTFIGQRMVDEAMERDPEEVHDEGALMMAVDVARSGNNMNVAVLRRGRRLLNIKKWSGKNTVETSRYVSELYDEWAPDALVVDGSGVGGGVVDMLRDQRNLPVIEFNGAERADEHEKYANKKSEVWYLMKEWISHAKLPADDQLRRELLAVTYSEDKKGRLQIASKKEVFAKLRTSTDISDAITMTFAVKVQPKSWSSGKPLRANIGTIA